MASTQIADVYNPLTFASRSQEAQIELNAFLRSGIAVRDALLEQQFAGGGSIGELPQYNGLTNDEPNYSSDNPASSATPAKVTSKKQIARSAPRNKHWSTMDLANELALEKPVGAITGRIGQYWATDDEKRIINTCVGILADNVANDGGDMVESVYNDVASPTDANKINGNAVIDAMQTLGDHKGNVVAIAMHSVQHAQLQKLQLLVDNVDPQTGINIQTYLGKRVIVDDSLPVVAGNNSPKYTVILFGAGAFGFAPAPVKTPSSTSRNELAGDGGGEELIHSRVNTVFHPYGFQCLLGGASRIANSYAELANANRWDRVVDRKNVPMAFLEVNG